MKLLLLVCAILLGCQKSNTQPEPPIPKGYEKIPETISITGGSIPEASGIADSKANPGYLWVLEDSGNPPMLYLLKHDGALTDSILLEEAVNRDWEDMALANGPVEGKNYLYVGDIGDNNAQYPDCTIYRFVEPEIGAGNILPLDKISFRYPDAAHDAEAFLVDRQTLDIYIITKRDTTSRLYRIPYPQHTDEVNEALYVAEFPYNGVVSASVSADGKEIIVKTYTALYYYTGDGVESLTEILSKEPITLDYQLEAQGEAVSFGVRNNGFFTLSEHALGIIPTLNFYKKK